ncbi:Uncharacterised protein [Vibrio cholerae]|nr:Uncharacterised protein [Vibrio cholerae]CSB74562.1 Uncharacterised protein [Vibrio cholerae]CSI10561.1 Uncharacterised protein [Vibrio cholerae]CSI55673.1 Uncharacterised protein [Vibrio cholerae]
MQFSPDLLFQGFVNRCLLFPTIQHVAYDIAAFEQSINTLCGELLFLVAD